MAKYLKMALWLSLVLVVGACSRHSGDFPNPIGVEAGSAPRNFAVTTGDNILYTLTWEISDPTTVSYYRSYVFLGQQLLRGPDSTSVTTVQYDFGAPVQNVTFGVSSVSVDNVESSIVYGAAR